MMRVISSPSSSTTVPSTLIFATVDDSFHLASQVATPMGRIQLTRFQKYLDIKILRRPSKLPERSQPALRSGLKGSAVTSRGVGWTGIVKRMLETSITVRWGD